MGHVDMQVRDGIALLKVTRQDVHNALATESMQELERCLDQLGEYPEVRVMVLTGEGEKTFISGGDLKEFVEIKDEMAVREMAQQFQRAINRLADLPIPVVAAIQGNVYGGGCEVALACDLRIMAEDKVMAFRQIRLGVVTGWGSGWRLVQEVGKSRAADLLFSGRDVTAREARQLGLVHFLAPQVDVLDRALQLAKDLSQQAPMALAAFKKLLNQWPSLSREEGQALELESFAHTWMTEDHGEAIGAVLEKRTPHFCGK